MYDVLYINDDSFTDTHWREYYELLAAIKSKYKEHLSAISWQELKSRLLSFAEEEKAYNEAVIMSGGNIVGHMGLWVRHPGTPDQHPWAWFDALYDSIPESLVSYLGQQFLTLMNRHKIDGIHFASHDERITAVARAWKAEELNRLDEFVLDEKSANSETLDQWRSSILRENKTLRHEFFLNYPERYVEQLSVFLKKSLLAMPREREDNFSWHVDEADLRRDGKWRGKNNLPLYCIALFDSGDKLVAFTEASVSPDNLETIDQLMTGVAEEYRGRGLAKWLKASMYHKLRQDFPEFGRLLTAMRAANKPIQHINAQMGFYKYRAGYEFRIHRKDLM